ncbi:MAG: prepilin-type N-terminal cleavage/methylation domain-containing protein [Deltaproteobacteria bacterium]|nr:prepilin-type N-terminal cleavage/methylation domain-containing protein [Deltaproteobacteria bacterium]
MHKLKSICRYGNMERWRNGALEKWRSTSQLLHFSGTPTLPFSDSPLLRFFNGHAGFTLIEILIAIMIFATLLTTIYTSYTGTFRVIEDTESQAEIYRMARIISTLAQKGRRETPFNSSEKSGRLWVDAPTHFDLPQELISILAEKIPVLE